MLYNQIAVCYIAHPNFPDGDWSWIRMGPSLGMTAPPAGSLPGHPSTSPRESAAGGLLGADLGRKLAYISGPSLFSAGPLRVACKPLPLIREGGSGEPAASS